MQPAHAIHQLQPSYIREILTAATSPEAISLAGGLPAEDCFPMALLAPAIDALKRSRVMFQYAATRGHEPLLAILRDSLALEAAQDLVVCNGSQQALDLVARTFLDPGDGVAMESPAYLGALQVFQLAGADILTVAQTPQGPDLQQLSDLFAARSPKLFYAVPDFHNPTGVCWSGPVREAVAGLCHHHGVTLVEDSPYRQIRFSGESLPRVSEICPEQAILLQSFSKTVAPGLRLGVAAGPEQWIDSMLRVKQAADLHTAVPTQALLHRVLSDTGFPEHLAGVCRHYGERYRALSDAIRRHLGGAAFHEPVNGGMFIWMQLAGIDTMVFAPRALQAGVAVVPGVVFYPGTDAPNEFLRLNFTHSTVHRLNDAVSRLADVLHTPG